MSKRIGIPLVLFLFFIAGGLWTDYFVARHRTRLEALEIEKNVEIAKEHQPIIEKALALDPRFKEVEVYYGKVDRGGFVIRANLESEGLFPESVRTIDATNPPRPVEYYLFLPDKEQPNKAGEPRNWQYKRRVFPTSIALKRGKEAPTDEARSAWLKCIIKDFPNSPEAREAKQLLDAGAPRIEE